MTERSLQPGDDVAALTGITAKRREAFGRLGEFPHAGEVRVCAGHRQRAELGLEAVRRKQLSRKVTRIAKREPHLFPHWQLGVLP